MGLIIIWVIFILTITLGVIGEGLESLHYLLYGFVMLYITYIYQQLNIESRNFNFKELFFMYVFVMLYVHVMLYIAYIYMNI